LLSIKRLLIVVSNSNFGSELLSDLQTLEHDVM